MGVVQPSRTQMVVQFASLKKPLPAIGVWCPGSAQAVHVCGAPRPASPEEALAVAVQFLGAPTACSMRMEPLSFSPRKRPSVHTAKKGRAAFSHILPGSGGGALV